MALWFGPLVQIVTLVSLILSLNYNQVHGDNLNSSSNSCNYFQGSWIIDNSYPLYDGISCPFIDSGFNCQRNGRPDKEYLEYRWQPTGCVLPRFNGQDFLNRFRGKKILFVGDSLSNNMWESLSCMLHTAVPNATFNTSTKEIGQPSTVSFPEYGVTVAYLLNRFLVDLVKENVGLVLKLDSISTGNQWLGADVLIFNTFHWWVHTGSYQTWDYYQIGNNTFKEMDHLVALQRGLTTWATWIDTNIDPSKTKVFFQGVSSAHYNGEEWNGGSGSSCKGQTQPMLGSNYTPPQGEEIVKNVLKNMTKPVYLLDVTWMTQTRKDAHPANYATLNTNVRFLDCSHWCLAGVPDTWNEILYAALLNG